MKSDMRWRSVLPSCSTLTITWVNVHLNRGQKYDFGKHVTDNQHNQTVTKSTKWIKDIFKSDVVHYQTRPPLAQGHEYPFVVQTCPYQTKQICFDRMDVVQLHIRCCATSNQTSSNPRARAHTYWANMPQANQQT